MGTFSHLFHLIVACACLMVKFSLNIVHKGGLKQHNFISLSLHASGYMIDNVFLGEFRVLFHFLPASVTHEVYFTESH